MKTYRVRWEIDVEADNPRHAAEKAREAQLRKYTLARTFDVTLHPPADDVWQNMHVVTVNL